MIFIAKRKILGRATIYYRSFGSAQDGKEEGSGWERRRLRMGKKNAQDGKEEGLGWERRRLGMGKKRAWDGKKVLGIEKKKAIMYYTHIIIQRIQKRRMKKVRIPELTQ